MLKGKAFVILISAVSAFVALAIAAIGVTFAWYSTHTAQQTGFELNANGIMVVYFEDEPVETTGTLTPAVSVKDEITENVVAFGNVLDAENPLLASPATTVTGNTYFEYLNSSSSDPENAGTIGATITLGADAKLVFAGGAEKALSLTRDLNVTLDVTVEYMDGVTPDETPTLTLGTTESFTVSGDCRVTVGFTVYLRQVDDLVDPDILRADHTVLVFSTVIEPDDDDE